MADWWNVYHVVTKNVLLATNGFGRSGQHGVVLFRFESSLLRGGFPQTNKIHAFHFSLGTGLHLVKCGRLNIHFSVLFGLKCVAKTPSTHIILKYYIAVRYTRKIDQVATSLALYQFTILVDLFHIVLT